MSKQAVALLQQLEQRHQLPPKAKRAPTFGGATARMNELGLPTGTGTAVPF